MGCQRDLHVEHMTETDPMCLSCVTMVPLVWLTEFVSSPMSLNWVLIYTYLVTNFPDIVPLRLTGPFVGKERASNVWFYDNVLFTQGMT